MQQAWQIGRIFGIPLRVHLSWVIIFALLSWSLAVGYFPAQFPDLPAWANWVKALVAAAMLFVSVILHELGHSLVARRQGVEIASITLFVFGGVSQMKEEPREAGAELRVAIAGPAVSLALAGVFALLGLAIHRALGPGVLAGLFPYLAAVNLMLAAFNLLPAFPLDGGRVLRAALWRAWGDFARATRSAVRAGRTLAIAMMVFGLLQLISGWVGGAWLALIGWFILQAGTASEAQASLRQLLSPLRVRDVMTTDVTTVQADTSLATLIDGYFARHTYGGYPVERDGRAIGLVSLRDLQKAPADRRSSLAVADIMVPIGPDLVVEPDRSVFEAFTRMVATGKGRLLVIERGRLVGLVTMNGLVHLAQVKSSLGV